MSERNHKGQFVAGNKVSSKGGKARAAALTAERRIEIARMGWANLVAKRFANDKAAARAYIVALGKFAYSRDASGANAPLTMRIRKAHLFRHPGRPEQFLQVYRAKSVPADIDFYS